MTVPCAGTPWSESFQPIRRAIASIAATGGATAVNVPMHATPVETLLKPWAWAPTIGRSIPPARPSKIWPYWSTRKL